MENEKKEISARKRLSVILNPLKTGEHSKNFPTKVSKFVKDPMFLSEIILKSVEMLEKSNLDPKERIAYINCLVGIHRTIFGTKEFIESKNINVNFQAEIAKLAEEKVYQLVTDLRTPQNSIDNSQDNTISNFTDKDIERHEILREYKEEEDSEDIKQELEKKKRELLNEYYR